MPLSDRPLIFIDVETTGLNVEINEVIELAAVQVHARTLEEQRRLVLKIKPENIATATEEALSINGYSEAAWKSALSAREASEAFLAMLNAATTEKHERRFGPTLCGHNVLFDLSFIKATFARVGLEYPSHCEYILDSASMAWPLYGAGLVEKLSLDAVCEGLGIVRERSHRALDDAIASLEVVRAMVGRVKEG